MTTSIFPARSCDVPIPAASTSARLGGVRTRGVQCRRDTEEECRRQGDERGECHHSRVKMRLQHDSSAHSGEHGHEQRDTPFGKYHARARRERHQQQAFGE